jgi:nucleoside-diphosphate-sugar epimerase
MMSRMANCIFSGECLKIFGDGSASRDYTYIDDIVESIMRGIEADCGKHEVLNVGSGNPISLKELISIFEGITGKKLLCEHVERIKEESSATWADSSRLQRILGYRPSICITEGVERFIKWYKNMSD